MTRRQRRRAIGEKKNDMREDKQQIPESSKIFPGNFPEISRKFPEHFRGISGKFPGHVLEMSRIFLEFSRNFREISKNFLDISRNFLAISRNCPRFLQGISEQKMDGQTDGHSQVFNLD